MKKRFFPGIDTFAERKRFAVFHACTIAIAPLIGAVLMVPIHWRGNSTDTLIVAGLGMLFSHMKDWLIWSLCAWNLIGSMRFHNDAFSDSGFGASRIVGLFTFIFFPLIYLYNLWCIIIKKDAEGEVSTN